jgi:hypothetical protein
MAKTPMTAAQRAWLDAEVRRRYCDNPLFRLAVTEAVSDEHIFAAVDALIAKGWITLVLGDDGEPLRLEWRQ